ncbi:MAG: hypothetical protein GY820_10845 [Gammaproteobacteria bacterium]|nr:hypothetical protein [Gammaproteobacteria bacterium]
MSETPRYSLDLYSIFNAERPAEEQAEAQQQSIISRPTGQQATPDAEQEGYSPYGFLPTMAELVNAEYPQGLSRATLPTMDRFSVQQEELSAYLIPLQEALQTRPAGDTETVRPQMRPLAPLESARPVMNPDREAEEVEPVETATEEVAATEAEETQGVGLMSPTVEALEGPEAAFSASAQSLQGQTEPLSKGSKGNNVLNAQLRLAELGYDIGRGGKRGLTKDILGKWTSLDNSQLRGVDSDFGPSTEGAVKAFQKDAGLPVTGIIDGDTAKAMSEKPSVQFEVPEDFTTNLSDSQKVNFNAAKDAATQAGLRGAEMAAFMAQVAHESDSFRTAKEYASGAAYEGRKDLGNTQPGDGKRYKGRGYIQLTGRANYEKAGKALGLDLVGNPALAEDPKVAADVSLWFWETQVRPQVPDFMDTERVTKVVNGGFNGLKDRQSYLEKFTKRWNED